MQVFLIAIALVVGSCFPAFAQELAEGDTVRLVERDPHIPAHPARMVKKLTQPWDI